MSPETALALALALASPPQPAQQDRSPRPVTVVRTVQVQQPAAPIISFARTTAAEGCANGQCATASRIR